MTRVERRLPRCIAGGALALAVTGATLVASGCATIHRNQAPGTEDLLVAAGFQAHPADTPQKMAQLKFLPALKMEVGLVNGDWVYTYADPQKCDCLYVGSPREYETYRHLALRLQINEEHAVVVRDEENRALDRGMWGPWGPR